MVKTEEVKLLELPILTTPGSCGEPACGAPVQPAERSGTFLPSIKAYLKDHPQIKSGLVGTAVGAGIMGTTLLFWNYPVPAFALFPGAGAIAGSKIPREAFNKGIMAAIGGLVGFGALGVTAALGSSTAIPTAFLISGIIGGAVGYVVGEVRSGL